MMKHAPSSLTILLLAKAGNSTPPLQFEQARSLYYQGVALTSMTSLRKICLGAVAGLAGSAVMHGFRLGWERVAVNDRDTIFGFDREADVNSARLIAF